MTHDEMREVGVGSGGSDIFVIVCLAFTYSSFPLETKQINEIIGMVIMMNFEGQRQEKSWWC